MSNTDVQFGSIILDTDSDDCEEHDDDYVASKERNEAKEPRSKKPKGNFTMYTFLYTYIHTVRTLVWT